MLNGVLAAMLTPIDEHGAIDHNTFGALGLTLLHEGCDGLVPFGTTGEFPSFSVRERIDALDSMIEAGVPADKIIVGTGASAVPDMMALSRHAMDQKCAGVLTGPPFYFKGVGPEALYATYASLIEGVGADIRLYLYHFPEMSSLPISHEVVERLHHDFPDQLAGLKDSAGDFTYSRNLIECFPDLSIFTGDDDMLLANLEAGGAGSITAGANLAVHELAFIRDNWRDGNSGDVEIRNVLLHGFWTDLLLHYPVTEALKEILADITSAPPWLHMRLPLTRLNKNDRLELLRGFNSLGINIPDSILRLHNNSDDLARAV